MIDLNTIADEIIAREGGYVDDPDDPGGPTKHGVTIHTLSGLPGNAGDLDGDGDVDREDVRAVSRDMARDLFITRYFRAPGLDALPEAIQPLAFDFSVHSGAHAVRVLQRRLAELGHDIAVDGVAGPMTARAAHAAAQEMTGATLRDVYAIDRRNWLYAIAERNPRLRKYARRRNGAKGGWIARAEAFMAAKYRLGPAEHRARVAQWA